MLKKKTDAANEMREWDAETSIEFRALVTALGH
jgi:hypothetical protein